MSKYGRFAWSHDSHPSVVHYKIYSNKEERPCCDICVIILCFIYHILMFIMQLLSDAHIIYSSTTSCMQKQTNSAPSVPPTLKFCPWKSERSVLSAPTPGWKVWIMTRPVFSVTYFGSLRSIIISRHIRNDSLSICYKPTILVKKYASLLLSTWLVTPWL